MHVDANCIQINILENTMPSLQVRELPEQIYHKIKREAHNKHRTLVQQAIVTLAKGLNVPLDPKKRRENLLNILKQNAEIISKYKLSDPVNLINKDRER